MRPFAPLAVVLLLVVIILRVEFFFTVIYFLVAIYLLSRFWNGRVVQHLRVTRRFVDRAFTGDEVAVDLEVRNAGLLPVPWLQVRESIPVQLTSGAAFADQVMSLGARGHWQTRYILRCRQRGYYQLGPLYLETGDLLGITHAALRAPEPRPLTVYPRVVPLPDLRLPTHSPMAALPAAAPLFEDSSRIRGVRPYQRGDAPRRVHWTASARAGQLLVKQYQPAIARETLLCLDLDETHYDISRRYRATELAIVVAASLATHMIVREGLPVGLATEALDPRTGARVRFRLPPRAERGHLQANLLDVLARVQVVSGAPFVDLLRRETVHLSWGGTVVAITGTTSDDLLATLLGLRRRGFAVSLVLVQPIVPPGAESVLSGSARLAIRQVWDERDLETWR